MHLPLRWWPSWMQRNHQLTLFRPQVRAFRTSPGKERAYIFLPIVVDEGQGETEIIATLKQQDFAHVGHVLAFKCSRATKNSKNTSTASITHKL